MLISYMTNKNNCSNKLQKFKLPGDKISFNARYQQLLTIAGLTRAKTNSCQIFRFAHE